MRLSRPRVVLRIVLLLLLAGYMAWRAHDTGRQAALPSLAPADALLLSRISWLEWALCALAAATASAVALSLRRSRSTRERPLQLGPHAQPAGEAGPGGPPEGPGPGASVR